MQEGVVLNFSVWPLIFLISTSVGFFLSLVLFIKRKLNPGNPYLAILILFFSISIGDSVLYWTDYFLVKPQLLGISLPFGLFFGPLFYLYVIQSVSKRKIALSEYALHFTLGLVYFIYLGNYYLTSVEEKLAAIEAWYNDPVNTFVAPLLKIISLTIYSYLVYRKLKHADPKLDKVHWVKRANVIFIFYTIMFVFYHILVVLGIFKIQWDYAISAAMVVFIYYIGYLGFASSQLMGGVSLKNGKYRSTTLTPNASKAIYRKLMSHLESQKPYLNPELRLTTLADQLSISQHQLSQVINEQAEMNFAELVNSYRIEEAKELILKEKKVIDAAYEVGFNNKTSFYKAFKRNTGKSPQDFKKSLKA